MGRVMGLNPDLLANLDRLGAAVQETEERRARREAGIVARRQRGCSIYRQQDEHVCGTCGHRWDADEEPTCPRS